ncbi:MAG: hypothetical protein NXI32_20530, partial [bacterium]|nr:hypothetical protein [bacterium]
YWPFAVATRDAGVSQQDDKVAFLKSAYDDGYESFRFGINDYGARSKEREGCILERGRNRWEIRLAEDQERRLQAFVNAFSAAGQAVKQWLGGACAKEIAQNISSSLVIPPGAKASHVITEEDCTT